MLSETPKKLNLLKTLIRQVVLTALAYYYIKYVRYTNNVYLSRFHFILELTMHQSEIV